MIAHSEVSDSHVGYTYECQAINMIKRSVNKGSLHSLQVNAGKLYSKSRVYTYPI